jgi:DNA-binding CsgD family transcriptional regulator/PAS domain-containing protein
MPKFDESKFVGLIDRFYEAAAVPELWRDVLAEFADTLGAGGCLLIGGPDSAFEPICSAAIDEALDFGNRNGWLDKNIRAVRRIDAFRNGRDLVTESTLFTEWELDNLPFNAEYVNRFGYRWLADMIVAGTGSSAIILSTQRRVEQDPFSRSEIATLLRFAPHLRRAGGLALRLAKMRHRGSLEALAKFDCGALLLDSKGRVIESNPAADALLGAGLVLRSRVPTAEDKTADVALQRLIRGAVARTSPEEPTSEPVVITKPNARPLVINVAPLVRSAQDLFHRAVAVLTISEPTVHCQSSDRSLSRIFGLTETEAAIGMALCGGYDIDEITGMQAVDSAAVAKHLESMQAKTGARHLNELVSLLTRYASVSN